MRTQSHLSLLDLFILATSIAALIWLRRSTVRKPWAQANPVRVTWINRAFYFALALEVAALLAAPALSLTPAITGEWIQAVGWSVAMLAVAFAVISLFWRIPRIDEGRRDLFRRASYAVPVAVLGYGVFIERRSLVLREVDVRIPRLPPDLEGFRIAQVTDIHMSAFFTRPELARVVAMANETKPHLTVVTGDLITRIGDDLDECIDELAKLRAEAGIFGCLGNHEIYAGAEDYTTRRSAQRGIYFLRRQASTLPFGGAKVNLIGYDYQRSNQPMLVGAESLINRETSAVNVLLSHNPNGFLRAQELGIPLTIAGHTHGGQVTIEILEQTANVARFATRYVRGLYREKNSSLYVSPGLGTVGVPIRVQVPPEVTLLRLRSA